MEARSRLRCGSCRRTFNNDVLLGVHQACVCSVEIIQTEVRTAMDAKDDMQRNYEATPSNVAEYKEQAAGSVSIGHHSDTGTEDDAPKNDDEEAGHIYDGIEDLDAGISWIGPSTFQLRDYVLSLLDGQGCVADDIY